MSKVQNIELAVLKRKKKKINIESMDQNIWKMERKKWKQLFLATKNKLYKINKIKYYLKDTVLKHCQCSKKDKVKMKHNDLRTSKNKCTKSEILKC